MTILEMLEKNPKRSCHPPESIFSVRDSSNEERLMCFASFIHDGERNKLMADNLGLMDWQVTKEHFTQEELDSRESEK